MLGKFRNGWDFIGPLSAHCAVHAVMTFMIAAIFLKTIFPLAFCLAAFDFISHFTMDRIKASPKMLGRFKALSAKDMMAIMGEGEGAMKTFAPALRSNVYFWWSLGLDQMIHHLTHYAIIYWLVTT